MCKKYDFNNESHSWNYHWRTMKCVCLLFPTGFNPDNKPYVSKQRLFWHKTQNMKEEKTPSDFQRDS